MNGDDSMKKICVLLLMLTCILASLVNIVYADSVPYNPYNPGNVNSVAATKAKTIWATIATIVQILAAGCVVFAGLRYMFAAPSQKADIKQGLIYLTIGAVLVFSATAVIRFVAKAAENVLN